VERERARQEREREREEKERHRDRKRQRGALACKFLCTNVNGTVSLCSVILFSLSLFLHSWHSLSQLEGEKWQLSNSPLLLQEAVKAVVDISADR
jgi:hypothetical protein